MFFNFKKIIILFLIVGLVAPAGFLSFPKKSEAGGIPVYDALNWVENAISAIKSISIAASTYASKIKELIGDGLAFAIAKNIISEIIAETIDWINTGFEGDPAYFTSPEGLTLDITQGVVGEKISESSFSFLCDDIAVGLESSLKKHFLERKKYDCKFGDNVENFIKNLEKDWDWNDWIAVTQDDMANPLSSYLLVEGEISAEIGEKKAETRQEIGWGQGFKPFQDCKKKPVETDYGTEIQEVCENVTPGFAIAGALNKSLGAGQDTLVAADEVDELIGALLSQLIKQALSGTSKGKGLRGYNTSALKKEKQGSSSGGAKALKEDIERAIKEEEEGYLKVKYETLALLENTKKTIEAKCNSSLAKKYTDQIDPLIEEIKEEINSAEKVINHLKEILIKIENSRKKKDNSDPGADPNASYTCNKAVSPSYTDGFFSLLSYKGKLLSGAFDYNSRNKTMLFDLSGKISPGIIGVGESVCVMRSLNNKVYAGTENEGYVYISSNGTSWPLKTKLDGVTVCGMTAHNGKMYVASTHPFSKKSTIYYYDEGKRRWISVYKSSSYVRDMVSYKGNLYAFGIDSGNKGRLIIFNEKTKKWTEKTINDRYFRANVVGGDLFIGVASALRSGVSQGGVVKYDGKKFTKLANLNKYRYVTYIKEWGGNLFAGTAKGFKDPAGTSVNVKGPTDLLFSADGGKTWKVACTVPEQGIWDLEIHNNSLYIATTFNGTSGGYVYEVKSKKKTETKKPFEGF